MSAVPIPVPLPPSAREYVPIAVGATRKRISERTMRSYAARGYFTIFRIPGRRGAWVDIHEVDRALARVSSKVAIAGAGAYGPNAHVVWVEPATEDVPQ